MILLIETVDKYLKNSTNSSKKFLIAPFKTNGSENFIADSYSVMISNDFNDHEELTSIIRDYLNPETNDGRSHGLNFEDSKNTLSTRSDLSGGVNDNQIFVQETIQPSVIIVLVFGSIILFAILVVSTFRVYLISHVPRKNLKLTKQRTLVVDLT
ncbi:hypothetical protein RF11_12330 [Thelohanellus kitauei]|uniref:Uncharacterized protein n=1 Tax=Thelohanellus kitauei TaxID=669202 RepID=A0A0C2MLX9_THEKT|nr:hypothetical protein RF11_12330 [Thelohanellus kitauei]